MLSDALVEAFVVPAEQREPWLRGQLARHHLRKWAPLWAQQDDRATLMHRLDRREEGIRLDEHACAATIGIVIHDFVPVGRPVAPVMQRDLDQTLLARAGDDALVQWAAKHLGQQGKDIEAHAGSSIPMTAWTVHIVAHDRISDWVATC